ncbi:MAG: hypothetical protein ABIN97_08345 [Ginsengibacter sp.]
MGGLTQLISFKGALMQVLAAIKGPFQESKISMIRTLLFLFLCITLASCNSDKKSRQNFKTIDFSYFDISPLSFSLRVNDIDSIILRQDFANDTFQTLKNDTTYHALLIGKLKQQFDSLMAVINFSKLDSVYETGHLDGDEYKLYIDKDTLKRQVYVHSMTPPKELEALKELFLEIRRSFLPMDTATHLTVNLLETKVYGNPKIFVLKDISDDKYYLADSINRIFQKGYIAQSPLIAIDGVVFKYQRNLDTIMLPLLKKEIISIDFLNKKGSPFIYGAHADKGAIIIGTTAR